MKLIVKKATTSKILHIFISDSSSTTGAGLTGLVHNSAGLTAHYVRPGSATPTAITLVTIGTLGTYVSSGFKEYDAANLPGVYEFDPPNAVLATGVDNVLIMLKGATNMAPLALEIQLVDNIEKDTYDRIGSPAGASIAADLVTVDNFVDDLETRCTEARLSELDPANLPADIDAILADTGTGGVLLAATATSAQLVDDVWDEVLTGATHNVGASAGKRLREVAAFAVTSGTAVAGTVATITLNGSASAIDNTYSRSLITITAGTGSGQTRFITNYNGTTKVTTVHSHWTTTPDATSEYQVVAFSVPLVLDHGTAQGATANTITLHSQASAINNTYLYSVVIISAGTGIGQTRFINSYNGTTKVATIAGENWVTTPDTTSIYVLLPNGAFGSICTEARLSELDAANLPSDVDDILLDTGTTLNTLITRALGLTQENYYIDNTAFIDGKLTSARMRTYSLAASVGTNNDVLATYTLTSTYDVTGTLDTYKVVKQ